MQAEQGNATTTGKETASTSSPTQKKAKRPAMIIIKYFEENDAHAKIIPRTYAFVVKTRHVLELTQKSAASTNMKAKKGAVKEVPTSIVPLAKEDLKERVNKLTSITGKEVMDLIKNDDKWLQKNDPITQILLYEEQQNKFLVVDEKHVFPLASAKAKRENVFTLHVKRTMNTKIYVQSNLTFSDCAAAEEWVSQLYNTTQMSTDDLTAAGSVRYLDVFHHAYARLYKGQTIPTERTGSIVKLMFEKRQSENVIIEQQKAYLAAGQVDVYDFVDNDDDGFEEGDSDDDEFELVDEDEEYVVIDEKEKEDMKSLRGYSDFVDHSKIPFQVIKTPEHMKKEKQRQVSWQKVKIPEKHGDAQSKKMKQLIRKGIPDILRGQVYIGLTSSAQLMKQQQDFYERAFQKVYGNYGKGEKVRIESIDPRMFPEFGGKLHNDLYSCLNANGIKATKRILCVLADQFADVDFLPCLPDVAQLLLMFMNEHYCYATLHQMLSISRKTSWYFRMNKMQSALFVETFEDIIRTKLPTIVAHMDKIEFDLSKIASTWFDRLFVSYLPFHIQMKLLDGFMNEGGKVLYRCGYALIKVLEKKILKCQSATFLFSLLSVQAQEVFNDTEFFKVAYGLSLKRSIMTNLDEKNRTTFNISKISNKTQNYVKPKAPDNSEIISEFTQWEAIYSWLPYTQRIKKATLAFSTTTNGYSLSNMVKLLEKEVDGPNLMIILAAPIDPEKADEIRSGKGASSFTKLQQQQQPQQQEVDVVELIKKARQEGKSLRKEIKEEEEKQRKKEQMPMTHDSVKAPPELKAKAKPAVFGVYSGECYETTYRYEGSTDTFLFSLYPVEAVYKWTRKNDFFYMGRNDQLVFGGGGEGPGLVIDDMMCVGTSQKCLTFENEPLCGSSSTFQIFKVEVYKFV